MSEGNKTSDAMESRNPVTVVFETGIFAVVMILSLFGNLMVCYAVHRNPRLRCPSNYYIISLALTDISQALFVMPLSVVFLATGGWPFGAPMCYFFAIVKFSLVKISIFTMALMALNRYYKIVRPARYQTVFTKRFILTTTSAVWLIPTTISLPTTLLLGAKEDLGFATCTVKLTNSVGLSALLIVLYQALYLFIGFCYWKIYRAVKMHNANISWRSANVEHVKVTKTLFVTVVGFFSLWLPVNIILAAYNIVGELPRQLTFFVTLLVFTSSCVNPFIYGFMNQAFKHEFKKFLSLRSAQSIATTSD